MQITTQAKDTQINEKNLLKIQVIANHFNMNAQSNLVTKNSSKVLLGEKSKGKQMRSLATVSFRKAAEDMIEDGVSILATLKSDEPIAPELECMAGEFKDAIKGDINSVVAPMNLKLVEQEDSKRVKIGTFKWIVSQIPGLSFPFYRVDRLKIMYLPLFSGEEAKGKTITFSIRDESKIEKDKRITAATLPINKMSMVELFTSYFVPREGLKFIEFGYKTNGIPVRDRAFGHIWLSFYVQRDFIPLTIKARLPIALLIEELDYPVDINKTSSIKGLIDRVNKRIAENNKNFIKEGKRNEKIEEERNSNIMFIDDGDTLSDENNDSDYGKEIVVENHHTFGLPQDSILGITSENIKEFLPRSLPIWDWDNAILDTGAPNHWFYHPNITGIEEYNREQENVVGKNIFRVKGVEVKLGMHWLRVKEAIYAKRKDLPLISYSCLVKGGIVDSLKSLTGNRAVLCLRGEELFYLDCSGTHMVFEKSGNTSTKLLIEA